jgi:hypothetical protein
MAGGRFRGRHVVVRAHKIIQAAAGWKARADF